MVFPSELVVIIINIGLPVSMLIVTYFIGNVIERKHFKKLQIREKQLRGFPVITLQTLPSDWSVGGSALVSGSVVVSLDYFKRIIARLRAIFGGRLTTYEPLLDRARREAVLRMTEHAKQRGFHAVINVRLETSRLANAARNGKGTAGIEILAFGTALTLS